MDALDAAIVQYRRALCHGVPRHSRNAFLLLRWQRASKRGHRVEAAVIFAVLSGISAPQPHLRVPFNINSFDEQTCRERFRFSRDEVGALVNLFGLRDGVHTRERTRATGIEALCIVTHKLAAPIRWTDVTMLFGRSPSGLSNIYVHVIDYLDRRYHSLLMFNQAYAGAHVQQYADAIFDAGGVLQNVWSFIDGTVRGICRPSARTYEGAHLRQQSVYNGHKRKHALKYQVLVTPDGLIEHVYGGFPGRNHDTKMYEISKIAEIIRADHRFKAYRIFGDQAYGYNDVSFSPYAGAEENLTEPQRRVNRTMSKVRVTVEWSFAHVVNYWGALELKHQQRTGVQALSKQYRLAVLFTNCISCVRGGNAVSDFFSMHPPSLEEYLTD